MTNTTDPIGKVKEIKDYLHLYFGCECMMTKNSYHAVHELHLSADSSFKLTGRLLHYFTEPSTTAECKPILRPLSDMTEEENKESSKLYFDFMETQKPSRRDITMMAHMTKWFLSNHFDLFGLIEAGLAIDKTKLTAHA